MNNPHQNARTCFTVENKSLSAIRTARRRFRLQLLLPTDTRGKARVDDQRVISGIIHVPKSGGRRVDAPEVYGPRKTHYNRFVRWSEKGVWTDILNVLSQTGGAVLEKVITSR